MSQLNSNKDDKDFLLMEICNNELKRDLKFCLMLISSKKRNTSELAKYEEMKKSLVETFNTDNKEMLVSFI